MDKPITIFIKYTILILLSFTVFSCSQYKIHSNYTSKKSTKYGDSYHTLQINDDSTYIYKNRQGLTSFESQGIWIRSNNKLILNTTPKTIERSTIKFDGIVINVFSRSKAELIEDVIVQIDYHDQTESKELEDNGVLKIRNTKQIVNA